MSKYTEDDIKEIGKLAALFFTPKDVAVMLGFDVEAFVRDCRRDSSPAYGAYHGPRLQQEMLLRKSIIDLALKGSTPAQRDALDFVHNVHAKMNER